MEKTCFKVSFFRRDYQDSSKWTEDGFAYYPDMKSAERAAQCYAGNSIYRMVKIREIPRDTVTENCIVAIRSVLNRLGVRQQDGHVAWVK